MKTKKIFMFISVSILGLFAFTSCKGHTHEYDSKYSYNEEAHWQKAICEHTDEKQNYGSHTYGEFVVTKEATHEEDGSKKQVCSVCGYENVVVIEKLDHTYSNDWKNDTTNHWRECSCGDKKDNAAHTYGEFVVTKDATHEEDGSKKQVCSVCGYENVVTIPALGHSFSNDWEKDSINHWHECSCGDKKDNASHTYGEFVVTKDATHEDDGSKKQVCSVCGYENVVTIPATGHTFNAPIWTWDGYKGATATFPCENDTSHKEEVSATITSKVTKEATCEETGIRTYTATVIFEGNTYIDTKTEEIPAIGHSFTKYVSNNDATCTVDGTKSATCDHEECNKIDTVVDIDSKLGHDVEHHDAKAPTCTTIGWEAYDTCSRCSYTTYVEIEALGHTYGEWIIDKEATCTMDGMKHRACTICEVVENRVIEMYGHNLIHHDRKAPTCTQIGWEAYDTCSRGDYTTYVEIEALGHTKSDWIIDEEATCTKDGSKHKECTVCHETLEALTIDMLGHSLEHHDAKAPTCIDFGWEAYDTCSRCSYTTYVEIEATGHTMSDWIIDEEATCLEGGSKHKECTVCQETLIIDQINPLGHSFTQYVSNNDATSTEDGTKTAICDRDGCNETDTITDEGSMLGHEYSTPVWNWNGNESATATFTCINCEKDTHKETLPATITSVDKTPATCTSDGVRTYTSKVTFGGIDYSMDKDETLTMLGHDYVPEWNWISYESVEVTFTCSHDNSHSGSATITGDGISCEITKSVTCTTDGIKTYTATAKFEGKDYTDQKTETINATGHGNWNDNVCGNCGYDAGGSKGLNMVWNAGNETFSVNGIGDCTANDIEIPATYNGYPVTEIGASAFKNYTNLHSIILPDSIISIGTSVFEGCNHLIDVKIPDNVTSYGNSVFKNCTMLESVVIGNGITVINRETFYQCVALTSITIPEGITLISDYAFYNCSVLSDVSLPSSLKSIGTYAFSSCGMLKGITIPEGVETIGTQAFSSSALREIALPNSITELGSYVFRACFSLTKANVPNKLDLIPTGLFTLCSKLEQVDISEGINKISNEAFYGCYSLKSLTVPEGVTEIGVHTFYNCKALKTLSLPDSLTKIAVEAFVKCKSLESLTLSNITDMGENAFQNCTGLKSLIIKGGIVGNSAFNCCVSLETVTLEEGVTSIDDYAFRNCLSLKSITIPNSIVKISKKAFIGCDAFDYVIYNNARFLPADANPYAILFNIIDTSITSFEIPESTQIISNSAFKDCNLLTSVKINSGLSTIGDGAFTNCVSLSNITIPNSVTTIGSYAFENCGMTSIVLPNSLNSIESGLFYNCKNLQSVSLHDDINYIGESAFQGCSSLLGITFPDRLKEISKNTFKDCSSLTNITVKSGITSIGDYAFNNCTSLGNVTILDGVTQIGIKAFQNCVSLTDVLLPKNLNSISNGMLEGCVSLISITIPNSVISIGDYAFSECKGLLSIEIPDGVTTIGKYAFQKCDELKSVKIAGSVKNIANNVFANCQSLTDVILSEGLTTIGNYMFYQCDSLKNVTLPESLTTIGDYAFRECNSLESITIPANVTDIKTYAFFNCYKLIEVYNYSSLDIIKRHYSNGYVAYNALVVYTSKDETSKIRTENDYVFYAESDSEGEKITLVGYIGTDTQLTLPTLADGKTYTINDSAFYGCTGIESVIIPDCVTLIGQKSFMGCSALKSVILPSNITQISSYTFRDCTSLRSITIPDSVTIIGEHAFSGCINLRSITLSNNLETICGAAFSNCITLTSITIPQKVNYIYSFAFSDCYNLIEIYNLSSLTITQGSDSNGQIALFAKDVYTSLEEASKISKVDDYLFYNEGENCYLVSYLGTEKALTLPTLSEKSYDIYQYAFSNSEFLESVIIPDCVSSIGDFAFQNCTNLNSITLGNQVTSIGSSAFDNCESLVSVVIPDSIISMGDCAFQGCTNLNSITFGNQVNSIGNYAFNNCSSLENVTFPNSLITIGDYAFQGCSAFTSVVISANVASIGNYVFFGCSSLTSATISCNIIGDYAFRGCSALTELELKDGVESIGKYAFAECSFTSFTIPSTVTKIDSAAFAHCDYLIHAEIPSTVTSVGSSLLSECKSLKNVVINSQISSHMFMHCYALENVTIGDGVPSITQYAFIGCESLVSITIPNSVTRIEQYAFRDCSSLANVTLGNGLISIEYYAFYKCSSIMNITIPDSVTTIDLYAFDSCVCLTEVTLGSGVNKISNYAFKDCDSLTYIYYKGTKENWDAINISSTGNDYFINATRYYYSETEPSLNEEGTAYDDNYWHYVDGEVVVWTKL